MPLVATPLKVIWNGHDWTGDGSIVLNECRKEVGWLSFPWPHRAIFEKLPPHVRIELDPLPRETPTDHVYVHPVQRFRILGLRLCDKIQGTIFHSEK